MEEEDPFSEGGGLGESFALPCSDRLDDVCLEALYFTYASLFLFAIITSYLLFCIFNHKHFCRRAFDGIKFQKADFIPLFLFPFFFFSFSKFCTGCNILLILLW